MLRAGLSVGVRLAPVTAAKASTSDGSSSHLVAPYATEGGSVPIYSMLDGRIQRRAWAVRNPEWCDLCNEPISQWVNHIGRKDHALLDQHYTQMVEWKRRWNPEDLIRTFQEHLGVDGIDPFHTIFSRDDQHNRNEIYALLVKLEEAGMLYFGEAKDTYLHMVMGGLRGMDHQGALVLHECLIGPFMHLYPEAHIQDYSNLVDFITCSYNMETVYDMLRLYTLDKVALKAQYGPSSPAAMGLGGIATSSSASFGYKNENTSADATPAATAAAAVASGSSTAKSSRQAQMLAAIAERERENTQDEVFSRKAAFMRQILGQLRWLLQPEQIHPAGYTFPEHIITLGELCLKGLVVQIIAVRVMEYMVRVEPVWHSTGFERRRQTPSEVAKKSADVLPRPFSYSYRTQPPGLQDLYTCHSNALDDLVVKGLMKKSLQAPPEFLHAKSAKRLSADDK